MQPKVRIELAVPWPEARRHLPKALYARLEPFLVDRELSDLLAASFVFDAGHDVLNELLARVEGETITAPGSGGLSRLFGKEGARLPLLRLVRHWTTYDFADLVEEPAVQLVVEKQVHLAPPLSQYYQTEIELGTECAECGRVHLRQTAALKITGGRRDGPAGEAVWQPDDWLAVTTNQELIVSDRLKQLWPLASDMPAEFRPVSISGGSHVWQVQPQGYARVSVPPTPLQERASCPACGRPAVAAYSTATGVLTGSAEKTVYDDEVTLYVQRTSLAGGDLWETDVQEGRVRFERDLLERFSADPEPFYVRTAAPFWLISDRLLRLLHENQPGDALHTSTGWRCKPVRWT